MSVNYLIWALAGPAMWPIWLLLLSVMLFLRGRDVGARRAGLTAMLLFTLFALLPTGYWLLRLLEDAYPPPATAEVAKARQIVVLSGGESLDASTRSPLPELTEHGDRLTAGAMLAERLPKAQLWVVGGVSRRGQKDTAIAQRLWRGFGIDNARIGIIDDTRDTCSNAEGVARELGDTPVLLVTSAFHMPRAMLCFERAGVTALPYPVDYLTWRGDGVLDSLSFNIIANLERVDWALHEFSGLLLYRAKGRIDRLWPEAQN